MMTSVDTLNVGVLLTPPWSESDAVPGPRIELMFINIQGTAIQHRGNINF